MTNPALRNAKTVGAHPADAAPRAKGAREFFSSENPA